jgi:hypothetical protein
MSSSNNLITVSIDDLQGEFMQNGMDPGQAARAAREAFPRRVAELLDQGWEVMIHGEHTVHLRLPHKKS